MSITPVAASKILIALEVSPDINELPIDGKDMNREEAITYCNQIVQGYKQQIRDINAEKQRELAKLSIPELIDRLSEEAYREGANAGERPETNPETYLYSKDLKLALEHRLLDLNVL